LRGEGGRIECKAAGPEKPEAYSLEYVEDFSGAENDAGGPASFAVVERGVLKQVLVIAT
jgi:hypothetical protein